MEKPLLTILGSAAAEGIPALFFDCRVCRPESGVRVFGHRVYVGDDKSAASEVLFRLLHHKLVMLGGEFPVNVLHKVAVLIFTDGRE